MKKSLRLITLFLLTYLFLASCVVSKKKYTELGMSMAKQKDSLNSVIEQNQKDFDFFINSATESDAFKSDKIDALAIAVNSLSADTMLLKQSLSDAIIEYNSEKDKLKLISEELNTKTVEIDDLKQNLLEKENELSELQKVIDNNKAETEKLREAISTALNSFDNTQLTVYQKNGKVYVKLEESLLFKSGSSKIDKKGEEAIVKLSEVLATTKGVDILVEGHTDNVGTVDYNWDLSTKRALAIVKIIEDNSDIDESRITAAGRCMFVPVDTNDTETGKQKNRRCEIILTPNLEGLYNILEE